MSSVRFNTQQQPKRRGYLSCMEAREGCDLTQLDFSAIEPTVLAQFSKCPTYRKLYGPEASPNHDVYMYIGARFPPFANTFTQTYDLDNPTKDGVSRAKKAFKAERNICKEAILAMVYGAGVNTVYSGLIRKEIEIELEQVGEMHRAYWSPALFAEVRVFEAKLKREWQRNNGWIVNGMGRPLAVAEDKLKDLLSRFCQSTGHDLLQRLLRYLDEGRSARGIEMHPWIVDFHDECIWENRREVTPAVIELMNDCMVRLNEELGWEIVIKGEPTVAQNLAQIKCEAGGLW